VTVQVAHHVIESREVTIPAKLDTAADVSAVPSFLVHDLQLDEVGDFEVEGYDNKLANIPAYGVSMALNGQSLGRLEVISIPSDYVLLGRDVLNQLRLLLDGPSLFLEILGD
jgi:hypothetical protein